eukprot:481792-Rhodomonas_salina.1
MWLWPAYPLSATVLWPAYALALSDTQRRIADSSAPMSEEGTALPYCANVLRYCAAVLSCRAVVPGGGTARLGAPAPRARYHSMLSPYACPTPSPLSPYTFPTRSPLSAYARTTASA